LPFGSAAHDDSLVEWVASRKASQGQQQTADDLGSTGDDSDNASSDAEFDAVDSVFDQLSAGVA
jgi:hypothetical protein